MKIDPETEISKIIDARFLYCFGMYDFRLGDPKKCVIVYCDINDVTIDVIV